MVTEREVPEFLAGWGVKTITSIEVLKPDRLFRIRDADGRDFALKCLPSDDKLNTAERLSLQHEILSHLFQSKVGVSVPIRHSSGKTWATDDSRIYVLSSWLDASGSMNDTNPHQLIPNWGRAVAELHVALSGLRTDDFKRRTWRNVPLAEVYEQCLPVLTDVVSAMGLADRLQVLHGLEGEMRSALDGLPEQVIHRDCHPENVVQNGNEVVGFVDCDHFSIGSPTHDIGYFLIRMVQWYYGVTTDGGLDGVKMFLTGYHGVRQLVEREINALPYMMVYVLVLSAERYAKLSDVAGVERELDAIDFVVCNANRIQSQALVS